MRKLIALLLTLSLLIGLAPAAFAADVYTLDIYWIANVNTDKPYKDLGAAIGDCVANERADKESLGKAVEELYDQYITAEDAKNAEIRRGVEEAINEYLAQVHKANKKVRKMQVRFHLIFWDPQWTEQAIGALMADEKIDLIFTADW